MTMNVGLCVGDWGGNPVFGNSGGLTMAQDVDAGGIHWIRWDSVNSIGNLKGFWLSPFPNFRVCLNFSTDSNGAYNTGGVQAINASTWATWALGVWQNNGLTVDRVPVIEILNEPYTAFWGTSANSQANAVAYGALIKQVYNTFHSALGVGCPAIIGPTFGGQDYTNPSATPSWWTWLIGTHSDIANYYDGVVMHPYGGSSGTTTKTASAAGCRECVTAAATVTGKPVWCTEYGWRNGKQTPNNLPDDGDGYQFTNAEVGANITGFNDWCRATGRVGGTFYFGYLDEPTPAFWGISYRDNPAGVNYVHKTEPYAALSAEVTAQAPPAVTFGRPSTDLSLVLVHGDKTTDRWGPDEPDGHDIPDDLTFTTSMPGGDKDLSCSLHRELSVYPDQVPFDDLFVYGPGNEVIWNGYMSSFPFDESGVRPTALGWVNSLTFDTRAREIYVERDMEKFIGEVPKNRRDALGTTYNMAGQVQIVPPNARIELSFNRLANANPPVDLLEVWFDGKGITLSSVYFTATSFDRAGGGGLGAGWFFGIYLSQNDSASVVDGGSMTFGTPGYLSASTSVPAKYIFMNLYYPGAFTGDGDWRGYMNGIAAYGNHGLTMRGSDPHGFYPSDIISDIVKRWGTLLSYTYPGSIEQDTTFVVPSFAQYDPSTGYDMLSAANAFQLKDWGVYSGGEESYPNRTFFLREPSPARLTWRARRSEGAILADEGVDAENLVNGVVVNWTGYDGNTYSVGPPSSGCQFTNSVLQDTDPTNPVNSHNLGVKYGRIDLSRKTDLISATRVGSTWLSRRIGVQHRGALTLRGWVRHPSGAIVPASRVRAGDYAIVEDDPRDQIPRKIVNTTYSHRDRSNQCDLEYEAFRIDALIEQLGAEVYGSSVT